MHSDTKTLVKFVFGLVIAAALSWALVMVPLEVWSSVAEGLHGIDHSDTEAAVAASEDPTAHLGLYRAMVIYLAIAFSIASIVGLSMMLWTLLRLEKDREALPSPLSQSH